VGQQILKSVSCSSSVEARLACLEERVLGQAREIAALKRALEDFGQPRVRPLTAR
jgi:hypothetical protein